MSLLSEPMKSAVSLGTCSGVRCRAVFLCPGRLWIDKEEALLGLSRLHLGNAVLKLSLLIFVFGVINRKKKIIEKEITFYAADSRSWLSFPRYVVFEASDLVCFRSGISLSLSCLLTCSIASSTAEEWQL